MLHRLGFPACWVRKSTGKPAFLTIEDRESDVRRTHVYYERLSPTAAESKPFSIHMDLRFLAAHPRAKRAYAWNLSEGENDQGERFIVVLEMLPVESAKTAVQASIMAGGQRPQS